MKKEDIIWYEHVRETGTGVRENWYCVDKKADNHQKYRRYREELDERKGDGEQQIVTLESICTESEHELDAKETPKSKSKREGIIMCEYQLNWSPVAETAIRYRGSAEFVQEILLTNAKVAGLGTVPAILRK